MLNPLAIFAPTLEAVVDENTFLSKHPHKILESGEQNDVPWMTGLNSDEGLLFTARIRKNRAAIDQINEDWGNWAPILLAYSDAKEPRKTEISNAVRQFYLGTDPVMSFLWNFQNFTDMLSDRLYFTATREAALFHSKKSPVYMYYYTYPAEFSFSTMLSFSGKLPPILELLFTFGTNWVHRTVLGRSFSTLGMIYTILRNICIILIVTYSSIYTLYLYFT
jgi:carboxylesterase type B